MMKSDDVCVGERDGALSSPWRPTVACPGR
jgi:hypothetical protein